MPIGCRLVSYLKSGMMVRQLVSHIHIPTRFEYHVDYLPKGWREKIPNGGYPSQRKKIILPCAAPVEDRDVVRRLRDLFLTSVPQFLRRLLARINATCRNMEVQVPG